MEYFSNEFFLIALTFGSYFVGKLLRRLTGWVIMNPILVSIVCIIAFLKITGVSYETYNKGGHMIEFWLRPAVVACPFTCSCPPSRSSSHLYFSPNWQAAL